MTTYVFLFINADKQMGQRKRIDCSSDEQAMETAGQEVGDHSAIEIWDGARPVGLVGNPRQTGAG